MKYDLRSSVVCVIGLGYVGLPLAEALSQKLKVIGFDTDEQKINQLSQHKSNALAFTTDPKQISKADFIIITVPTPVTKSKEPDLSYVIDAARKVSQTMKKGCTVILESTVYPGATEDVVKPVLEEAGLKCGDDFKLAYSPERINPGDKEHTIDKTTKIVAGVDEETTGIIAELYRLITPNIFPVRNIRTAEAAKVIENVQRDLNIALMNELAIIFEKMGLDTREILDAAGTKWNFHRYSPGLVGGHCIPVDPYYLVYKAKELDYHPQVILAGRAINDYMPKHVAEMTIKALNNVSKVIKGSKVLIMGLTYKENVADPRETPAKEIIKELQQYGVEVLGYDPRLTNIEEEFEIKAVLDFKESPKVDCIIVAVAHDTFQEITLGRLRSIMKDKPILVDVRGLFSRDEVTKGGFYYTSL
jgi:UDPglucose 6-dehydrogenase/UDP-N-acetyl-D-galactosamine dehydrogenase